jgi:hypothetical protein
MDTSSKGVNLQVRLTGSGERARSPLGSMANLECSLLWEYVLQTEEGVTTSALDIACDDRGPVGAA